MTWTQVAQYIVLIIAYLVPVIWLSMNQTGIPVPQAAYGYTLAKVTAKENQLLNDAKELEVREIFLQRSLEAKAKLSNVPAAMMADRALAKKRLDELRSTNASIRELRAAEIALTALPRDTAQATAAYTAAQVSYAARAQSPTPQAQAFAGETGADQDVARKNFLALVFCLMIGTAALPHILTRYYTTPTVREARESVSWSIFFIFCCTSPPLPWPCWQSLKSTRCPSTQPLTTCQSGLAGGARLTKRWSQPLMSTRTACCSLQN